MAGAIVKRWALVAAACWAGLAGCATSGNPQDPVEGFNRAMFAFNEGLDKAVIKPVAQGYEAAVPVPARTGVANFFANLGDLWVGVNNLLQGKPAAAGSDAGRVLVNTTLGVFGLFDVATEMGLEKHEEDFGQTLGRWGVGDGAYVVLPFFGPRTARDAFGLVVDSQVDLVTDVSNVAARNSFYALRVVSDRTLLLPADKVLEEAALDRYSYVRDAYLQRRRSLIYDGDPPRQRFDSRAEPAYETASLMDPVVASTQIMLVGERAPQRGRAAEAPERVAAHRP